MAKMEKMKPNSYHRMSQMELNRAIAERLSYTVYHYNEIKSYYRLMDEDWNPVVLDAGLIGGQRETEEEAWNDVPQWASDIRLALSLAEADYLSLAHFALYRYRNPFDAWFWEAGFVTLGNPQQTFSTVDNQPEVAICTAWLKWQDSQDTNPF